MSGQEPCSVCLTFDFDAMSSWITTSQSDNPSMISRGEFGIVGMQRILELLKRHEARATFFVPGHTMLAYPRLVQRVCEEGHELGHHGWAHENPANATRSEAERILELGFAAAEQITGTRPTGYRSPAWSLSADSVDLFVEAGFVYDSSCMAGDFYPYYLRTGDSWSTHEPYRFGTTTSLVEMPVAWALDDFPQFELIPGRFTDIAAPDKVFGIWREEFAFMSENCPGGCFTLTLHPECVGRGHRIAALDSLMTHMRESGAVFEPLVEYANRWASDHPRDAWMAANPERTGAEAIQGLEQFPEKLRLAG